MFDMPSGSFPNYNHDKYGDNPGQLWTADDQCRILLRDRKAYAFISNDLSVGLNFLIYSYLKFQRNFFCVAEHLRYDEVPYTEPRWILQFRPGFGRNSLRQWKGEKLKNSFLKKNC